MSEPKQNAPSASKRATCWAARDAYLACLNNNPSMTPEDCPPCSELRDAFDGECPKSWSKSNSTPTINVTLNTNANLNVNVNL
eukprot:Pgem_evm1s11269